MSLTPCPHCKHQIHSSAKSCPSCGAARPPEWAQANGQLLGAFVLLVLAVPVILIVLGIVSVIFSP
jgi:hypothetical protein